MDTNEKKPKSLVTKLKKPRTTKKINVEKPIKKPVNYLNNKDLLIEIAESKKQNNMTKKLAHMLILLTARYASKGNFANYSYLDDMKSYALLMLCKTWTSFNPDKSKNPFAFFTQCIKNSFRQYLNIEKRHRNIRDQMLVDHGMTPSHRFQIDHQTENSSGTTFEISDSFFLDHYDEPEDY